MSYPSLDLARSLVTLADASPLLPSAGALRFLLAARQLDLLLRHARPLQITRFVSDALEPTPEHRAFTAYSRRGDIVTVSLAPLEARECTRLWIAGWPGDLASLAAVAIRRGGTVLYTGDPLPASSDLQAQHCRELVAFWQQQRLVSPAQAEDCLQLLKDFENAETLLPRE